MTVATSFRAQAMWCERLGSPFTAALLEAAAADIDEGGPVAELMRGRAWREADAAALRFAGAAHAAALKDPALYDVYPWSRNAAGMERVWPLVRDLIVRDRAFFDSFLAFAPQTNEARRAIALLPAFLALGARSQPLHMLELGASAGLNLMWDCFDYVTSAWAWRGGDPQSPCIDAEWRGATPAYLGPLSVASRAGCDINPMNVADHDAMNRLRAFVWPDQPERLERFHAALALAQRRRVRVDKADAGAWLEAKLAGDLPEGVTILHHSIVWQYFPEDTRRRARAAIDAAAARATPQRRFAWVRFEHEQVFGGAADGHEVDMLVWPGGERRLIAKADPHARWIEPA